MNPYIGAITVNETETIVQLRLPLRIGHANQQMVGFLLLRLQTLKLYIDCNSRIECRTDNFKQCTPH